MEIIFDLYLSLLISHIESCLLKLQYDYLALAESILSCIAGEVKAFKDLWIIGDQFVNEVFHALQELQQSAKINKKRGPFIYDEFNVRCFTSNPLSPVKNVAVRW